MKEQLTKIAKVNGEDELISTTEILELEGTDIEYTVEYGTAWSSCRCSELENFAEHGCLCEFTKENPHLIYGVGTILPLSKDFVYIARNMTPDEAQEEYDYRLNSSGFTFYYELEANINQDALESVSLGKILEVYFKGVNS